MNKFAKIVAGTLFVIGGWYSNIAAQGINVPAGSQLKVNAHTLRVSGAVTNAGTLSTTSGTISLTGNWTNSGTFTPSTGSVEFTGTGTQTLVTGGAGAGNLFYNLTHSSAGKVDVSTNAVDVDNDFTISSTGEFDMNGLALTIAGDFTGAAGHTFTPATNTVTFDGTTQTISAAGTTFYNLTKSVTAADTITFVSGINGPAVSNLLTLTGTAGNILTITSNDTNQAKITLSSGGTQSLNYLEVGYSDASAGVTLIARNSTENPGSSTTNWSFNSGTFTWEGDISSDWSVGGNWDVGIVPTSLDTVIIPDVATQPVLTADVTVANLTISQSGATLDLDGSNLVISGTLSNVGTIYLDGNETVTIATTDTDSGTFNFLGDADANAGETFTIPDISAASTDYYNVVFNSTVNPDFFDVSAGQTLTIAGTLNVTSGTLNISTNSNTMAVAGALTVDGGTLTATNGTIDANGAFTISSGTITAPDSGGAFTVAGNFTQSGGTFTHSSGTVTLDGSGQTISASTTDFYNLTKSVTSADTLTFATAVTQANNPQINGKLTLTGTSGNLLSINSDVASTEAYIELVTGGTQELDYLDVRDSDAGGAASTGVQLVARHSTQTNGGNTNWVFGAATITWDGSTDTDWDTLANWDLGLVPNDDDTVIIPNVANDPSLSAIAGAGVQVENLTINANGILTLAGKNLTVDATFSNSGTISMFGNETVTLTGGADTDSGAFLFTGDGDGSAEVFTFVDIGATDFYNVTFNDSDANCDTIRTNGNLTIAGTLNVTDCILDISTNANTLTVAGIMTVDGGTLTATDGTIDANSSVVISSGTLTAPDSGGSFTVADDWTFSGGTFTHSSGKVTFDTTATASITGATTFYDFTSIIPNKTLTFEAAVTQTIANVIELYGSISGELVINSDTLNTQFNIDITGSSQTAQFLNVTDSNVDDSNTGTNNITCFSCTNNGGNDNGDPVPHWIFSILAIDVPSTGKTVDTTPTFIGQGNPGSTIDVYMDPTIVLGTVTSGTIVASAVADANGNWRDEVDDSDAISTGSHTFVPAIGTSAASTITVTIADPTTTSQVPTITNLTDLQRISGGTPIVIGQGATGQTIDVLVADDDDDFLLQTVNAGETVDGSGDYSLTSTTTLTKGRNYISVTIDGVASDIIEIILTDPYGVVFDSISNQEVQGATVSLYRSSDDQLAEVSDCTNAGAISTLRDLECTDVNPVTTGQDGFYSFVTVDADYYFVIEQNGYDYPSTRTDFDSGRAVTTGSKGETFTVNSVILNIDQPADPNGTLLRIVKDANKADVKVGDVVTYSITIENQSPGNVNEVYIEDRIPPGFKYLKGRAIVDDLPIGDPDGARPITFRIGTIPANGTVVLKYQLVVGSGVTYGKYENRAFAKYSNGFQISNVATEEVTVVMDPLFDLSTVIGKVFLDHNENGIQDAPEYVHIERSTVVEDPIPGVRIVMEDGTVITTDKYGRFSVPGLIPGRHLFRIDERTLPEGSYLTTDKVVVVNITPGILTKVNFGVALDYGKFVTEDDAFFTNKVKVNVDENRAVARLNASMYKDPLVYYNGIVVDKVEFRIFSNYTPFIEYWNLRILDADTNKIIKSFEGNALNVHDPILWDGKDEKGEFIKPERNYVYLVYVENADRKYDETKPLPINFTVLEDDEAFTEHVASYEFNKDEYTKWINEQRRINNLFIQTIIVDGETILVDPIRSNVKSVQVMKDGLLVTEIPILERKGLTARQVLENQVSGDNQELEQMEIILPRGDYEIVVQEDQSEVADIVTDNVVNLSQSEYINQVESIRNNIGSPTKSYVKKVTVGEDRMFFVAMGDASVGYNFNEGDIEPVQQSDKFKEGFWSEGKLAYYLKGKILGKYLITSSYDSQRETKQLFKDLKEDEYYPVYGDDSSVNYDATNTQGNLYLMLEWDKSSATWGNYSIAFKDTEFANFTRSIYGGKVDFHSVGTTKYGEEKTQMIAFNARAKQKSAHVEMLSTGGSLYFLKHAYVLSGTDTVKIEIRDEIDGTVIGSKEMVEGADYDIDYSAGRIIFWRPVPMLVESMSIISNDLLAGNLIYVVADYEYEVKEKVDEATYGTRFRQAVTDNLLVGGTFVKENLEQDDYQLQATDITLQLGNDAKITAEYAQSQSEVQGTFVTTDGGLTYTEIPTEEGTSGRAYGIKGDARLFNRLGLSGYYKWVGNDFSTSATTAQQGKELIGLQGVYDINDDTRITLRQNVQRLIEDGNAQTQAQVGGSSTTTTLMQIVREAERLRLRAQYQRTTVKDRLEKFDKVSNSDLIAVAADYALTDDVTLNVEQQFAISGDEVTHEHATTIGATFEPRDDLQLSIKERIAQSGTATTVGVKSNVNENIEVGAEYGIERSKTGGVASIGSVESTTQIGEIGEIKTTYKVSGVEDSRVSETAIGAAVDVTDKTQLRTSIGVQGTADDRTSSIVFGGSSQIDESASVTSQVAMASASSGSQSTSVSFGGTSQVDKNTTTSGSVAVTESNVGDQSASYTFGTSKRLNDDIQLISSKTFGTTANGRSEGNSYGLSRVKDGKKLEGTLAREFSQSDVEISKTNIFGLSGDITDRWAFEGSLQSGDVQNLDGSDTKRDVASLGVGYAKTDPETGETFKGSSKLEVRFDEGDEDKIQYLATLAMEGRVNPELSLYGEFEHSKTKNTTTSVTETESRKLIFGGAYRPIMNDQINLLGRYTYLENKSPESQSNFASIEEERAHVFAGEAIYDLTSKWQLSEKFALRIAEEKVAGFAFTKTHTWLMIHRLNYKFDQQWILGGEFRSLTQTEAADTKRGVLIELARNLGEYAQLGLGYNFTQFDDDLTNLDYETYGPFVRLTGKFYDQTPEQLERSRQKWIDEKVQRWAWFMVSDELSRSDSPVLYQLNSYFYLAEKEWEAKRYAEARRIYKDIIIAGNMMFEEAAEYIRSRIKTEEELQDLYKQAEELMKNEQYEKAKKIFEKILEETQSHVLE